MRRLPCWIVAAEAPTAARRTSKARAANAALAGRVGPDIGSAAYQEARKRRLAAGRLDFFFALAPQPEGLRTGLKSSTLPFCPLKSARALFVPLQRSVLLTSS